MPIKQESLNNQLEDELSKYNPVPVTSGGKEVDVADEADVFRFDFIKDGINYGPVHVSIDGTSKLIIYYSKDVQDSPRGRSIEGSGEESFDDLCKRLYRWAVGHQLRPQKVYSSKLGRDMAKREHTKRMDEGYYPIGKKASYSDNISETKIIIQHSRALEEGEQRFRNIARIFVENASGERFLLDTKMPGLARVHARNIAEGHTPYDERGRHISNLISEYNTMAGFCRATKHNTNESISHLVETGFQHYGQMRETLRKLSSKRGYKSYFESWTPTLNEEVGDDSTSELAEMFLNNSIDPRIENALPILSKLAQPVMEMQEISELEEWSESIVDEALRPNTKAQAEDLATLLRKDNLIPFGPNALTVKSELAGLLDNEQLNKKLEQLSHRDPDADAKDAVLAWMELSRDPVMHNVIRMVKGETHPEPTPIEQPTQPKQPAPQQPMQPPVQPEQPLQEFAMDNGEDDNEPDEEAILRQLASQWWRGDGDPKVERTLAAMGWEIGQDESGDEDAGVFLVRAGDVNGNSYMAFLQSELELDEGDLGDMRDFFKTQQPIQSPSPITARVTKQNEGLDANQKRVGQLGPKAKYAKQGDLVGTMESFNSDITEIKGDFEKALDKLSGNWSGWYKDESSDPNIEKYFFDDGEGGYDASGTIEHDLQTGKVTVDYSGDEYHGPDVKGTFDNFGDAMRALRGGGGNHGGRAPSFDNLRHRTSHGSDDLRKTDRTGRKGTLAGGPTNRLKQDIQFNKGKLGPKGVLPEGQEDLDAIKRLLGK